VLEKPQNKADFTQKAAALKKISLFCKNALGHAVVSSEDRQQTLKSK
jgi:hypothetical protein